MDEFLQGHTHGRFFYVGIAVGFLLLVVLFKRKSTTSPLVTTPTTKPEYIPTTQSDVTIVYGNQDNSVSNVPANSVAPAPVAGSQVVHTGPAFASQFQVYQNNNYLKGFDTLAAADAFANQWDHASVRSGTDGTWIYDTYPGHPAASATPTATAAPAAQNKITLTSTTTLFASPDTGSAQVGAISAQPVTVLQQQGGWYQVQTFAGAQWIKPNYKAPTHVVTETVKKNDTLWGIAQRDTGNGLNYKTIAAQNGLTNPNSLQVGQHINVTVTNNY